MSTAVAEVLIDPAEVVEHVELKLRRQVTWIATKCFPDKVGEHLGEIRDIILDAHALGVEELVVASLKLNDTEVQKLFQADVLKLARLRRVGMSNKALELLQTMLYSLGVPEHYYITPPAPPLPHNPANGPEGGAWDSSPKG